MPISTQRTHLKRWNLRTEFSEKRDRIKGVYKVCVIVLRKARIWKQYCQILKRINFGVLGIIFLNVSKASFLFLGGSDERYI